MYSNAIEHLWQRDFVGSFLASISCIGFCMLLAACSFGSEATRQQAADIARNYYTLIFIDKTVSVKTEADYVRQKYAKALERIIRKNIQKKNDKVEVYFLHENTLSGRVFSYTCRLEPVNTDGLSPTDANIANNNYTFLLRKEQNKVFERCLQALDTPNQAYSRFYTDIWSSLSIIDKKRSRLPANTQILVYYLSDMVESMPGANRRDFYKNPLYSHDVAIRYAKADLEHFKALDIADIYVYYVLPFSPLSPVAESNPFILTYWSVIFEHLDVAEFAELEE